MKTEKINKNFVGNLIFIYVLYLLVSLLFWWNKNIFLIIIIPFFLNYWVFIHTVLLKLEETDITSIITISIVCSIITIFLVFLYTKNIKNRILTYIISILFVIWWLIWFFVALLNVAT